MFKVLLSFFILFSISFANQGCYIKKANLEYEKQHYKKAFKLYNQCGSNIIALNNIAMMYYNGQGTKPDQAKAVNILKNLLKNKNLTKRQKAEILYNLGIMYFSGYVNNFTGQLIVDRMKTKHLMLESSKLGYLPAKKFYKQYYETNSTKPKKK